MIGVSRLEIRMVTEVCNGGFQQAHAWLDTFRIQPFGSTMSTSTHRADTVDSRDAHVCGDVAIGAAASGDPSKGQALLLAEL